MTKRSTKIPKTVTKKPASQPAQLSSAWALAQSTAMLLWRHRRLFGGILLVYGVLSILLVQNFSLGGSIDGLKQQFSSQASLMGSSLLVFGNLISTAGSGSSPGAGIYQFFLLIMSSLAIIWALRQLLNGLPAATRDSYYRGMYPLVPFIIILLVIGLELLPVVIGGSIYSLVVNNGIAASAVEKLVFGLVFAGSAVLSLYLLSTSLFGIYLVAEPEARPIATLRTARHLVRHHHLSIIRKVLFLSLIMLLVGAVIMVPAIIISGVLAAWVFFALGIIALPVAHTYMYILYRELAYGAV